MSLTKDWEYKLWPLAKQIMQLVYAYDINNDDGETESEIHDLLCSLVEAIEDWSDFDADTQLYNAVRQLTERKTEKDLLIWEGKKCN